MTTDPQALYTAAYSAHNQERNLSKAIALYVEILRAFPGTNWASYAKEQMEKIEADPSALTDPAVSESLRVRKESIQSREAAFETLRANQSLKIKHILSDYVGHTVGINAFDPSKVEAARLVEVQDDHFTVESETVRAVLPYVHVVKLLTSPTGS